MANHKINSPTKRYFFHKIIDETGDLTCAYCGQPNLIIYHFSDPEIPKYRRATLDHYIPISRGGSQLDKNNWKVACQDCNDKKDNYMPKGKWNVKT